MEVLRCRFTGYNPGEIMHLAPGNSECLCLFEDSRINLYKIPSWSLLLTYPPTKSLELRRVVWLSPNTFAACGLGGLLLVFNTSFLEPIFSSQLPGNGVWDMSKNDKTLSLACDDGILRLFIIEDDEFYISSSFPKQDSKLLSVLSQDSFHFTGTSSGALIKFSEKGQVLQRMQTDSSVWSLAFSNDFLISGESSGFLSFWQHSRGVLKQNIKTHEGDILTICVNHDTVYSSGVDSKVVRCELIQNEWIVTGKAKGQSHDVRTLVFSGVLLSGGITSDICEYTEQVFQVPGTHSVNIKGQVGPFKKTPLRHVPTLPYSPVAKSANNMLLECKNHSLDLWTVDNDLKSVSKFFTLNVKGNSGVSAFDIHKNGSFVAYATVFATRIVKVSADDLLVEFVEEKFKGCNVMAFGEEHLFAAFNEYFTINLNNFDVSVFYRFDSVATRLAIDGIYSAVLIKSNKVYVFKHNKLIFQLPAIDRPITAMALAHNSIFIATEDNCFQGFSCKTQQLENFSSKYFNRIPSNFTNDINRIIGILPFEKQKIILYTHYSFTVVDLTKKPPKRCGILTKDKFPEHKHTWAGILSMHSLHSRSFKENGEVSRELENFVINKRFGPILSFDILDRLAWICELDWEKTLDLKAKPLAVHKYGT